jgi:DNA-directed RNA polymerase specialized sigma24 family protein
MHADPGEITRLLAAWRARRAGFSDYRTYQRTLHQAGRFEPRPLAGSRPFSAICAQLIRRILVDCARSRRYAKRGGEATRVTFERALETPARGAPDWVAIDDVLNALEAVDARKCRLVEPRFFGGLNAEETAEAPAVSVATVYRDWRLAAQIFSRQSASFQGPIPPSLEGDRNANTTWLFNLCGPDGNMGMLCFGALPGRADVFATNLGPGQSHTGSEGYALN